MRHSPPASGPTPGPRSIVPFRALSIVVVAVLGWPSRGLGQLGFQDISDQLHHDYRGETFGAAVGDVNGDGWPDVWLSNHRQPPALLLNLRDGRFLEVIHRHGLPGVLGSFGSEHDMHAAAWADMDQDGDLDLLQLVGAEKGTGLGPNLVFRNDGGRFVEIAEQVGLTTPLARGRTPLWLDWDGDGVLEALTVNKARSDREGRTCVFQWRGQRYEPRLGFPGLVETDGNHAYAQLVDCTGDGAPEVLFGGDQDGISVYATGAYASVDLAGSLGLANLAILDSVAEDLDGDLRADLYLVMMRRSAPDRLFLRTPAGFVEASGARLPPRFPDGTSVVAGDFDNDMDLDLYVVRAARVAENPANVLLENRGNAVFRRVPNAGGAAGTTLGQGDSAVTLDVDRDGFLDLLLTNGKWAVGEDAGPLQLFRNRSNHNHWIEIDLVGTTSNRDAIGAKVLARTGAITQVRFQHGGMHNFAQNHPRIHFGLGAHAVVTELTVVWPGGRHQVLRHLPGDRLYRIQEP